MHCAICLIKGTSTDFFYSVQQHSQIIRMFNNVNGPDKLNKSNKRFNNRMVQTEAGESQILKHGSNAKNHGFIYTTIFTSAPQ